MVQIIKSNWWWGSWWGGWEWDMKKSVYDPNNVGKNVYDYTYFINKPTIPTKTSDLNNDSGFITNSALSGYQTTANIRTNLTSPDNTHYPSTKAVSDALASKQWTLTAGTGINITNNVISATWGWWGLWNSGINTFVLEDPTDPTELANLFTWTESWFHNEQPEVWVIISYWLLFYFAGSTTEIDYYYCPDEDFLIKVNVEVSEDVRTGISSVVVCEWFHYWQFYMQSDFSDIASVWALISNWLTETEQDTDDFIPARIIVWSDTIYERNWMPVENSGNYEITFMCTDSTSANSVSWTSRTYHKLIIFTFSYSSGTWTYVSSTTNQVRIITPYVLRTDVNYANPYTPLYNGSPATKKYVDDSVSVVSGDSGVTYTIKVSNSDPTSWTPATTITFVS